MSMFEEYRKEIKFIFSFFIALYLSDPSLFVFSGNDSLKTQSVRALKYEEFL